MSKTRPRAVLGALALLGTAVLAGCGGVQPGVAAQVGDERISMAHVDELAGEYCQAVTKQLEGNNQQVPQRYLRAGIAGSLTARTIAEQLAAEYGVDPGDTYDQQVADLRQQVAVLDDEVQDAVVEVESSKAYVEAIQVAIGDQTLAADGTTGASYDEKLAKGTELYQAWIDEHGVEFDPSLGIALDEGKIANVDTSLSYALSDNASAGAEANPNPEYSRQLPDAHRCG